VIGFDNLIERYKSLQISKSQKHFLIATLLSLAMWPFFYYWTSLDNFLSESLLHTSRRFVGLFTGKTPQPIVYRNLGKFVMRDERASLLIGHVCNGKSLYYLLIAFIFAIPDRKLKTKITYSILGLIILYILNSLRISALFQIAKKLPDWFHVFHHDIFQYSMYAVLFAIWIFYLKNTGNSQSTSQS
jgi:exosortase/archaeosortase family protein